MIPRGTVRRRLCPGFRSQDHRAVIPVWQGHGGKDRRDQRRQDHLHRIAKPRAQIGGEIDQRGVGFVPRFGVWRWLFSGWACAAGLLLAAWADGFTHVGWPTLVALGVLTVLSLASCGNTIRGVGADAANYSLVAPTTALADILKKPITATVSGRIAALASKLCSMSAGSAPSGRPEAVITTSCNPAR